jgi:hypothetical protein
MRSVVAKLGRRLDVVVRGPGRVRVLVLGHQKSGTTAVGALLASATGLDFANDPLYRVDWGQAGVVRDVFNGDTDLALTVEENRLRFCSRVLKDPDLSFLIEDCVRVFPNASLVNVARDPRHVIRSIADRLNLSQEDLRSPVMGPSEMSRHWRLILDGVLPEVPGSTVVERLIWRWKQAWAQYVTFRGQCELLRYEDFMSDKAAVIYELADKLGLEVRHGIEDRVDVQFQQRGRSGVPLEDRLGIENVRTIESLCEEEMDSLGYSRGQGP